jgi:hypothetical protein
MLQGNHLDDLDVNCKNVESKPLYFKKRLACNCPTFFLIFNNFKLSLTFFKKVLAFSVNRCILVFKTL